MPFSYVHFDFISCDRLSIHIFGDRSGMIVSKYRVYTYDPHFALHSVEGDLAPTSTGLLHCRPRPRHRKGINFYAGPLLSVFPLVEML